MDKRTLLSLLWITLTVNFIFCDVFTLMHAPDLQNLLKGDVDGMAVSQSFLFSFAIVMEIPMMMILLSRILPQRPNRILQILFGVLLMLVQIWSLGVGKPTMHYWFFSIVEIGLLAAIVWQAFNWSAKD